MKITAGAAGSAVAVMESTYVSVVPFTRIALRPGIPEGTLTPVAVADAADEPAEVAHALASNMTETGSRTLFGSRGMTAPGIEEEAKTWRCRAGAL